MNKRGWDPTQIEDRTNARGQHRQTENVTRTDKTAQGRHQGISKRTHPGDREGGDPTPTRARIGPKHKATNREPNTSTDRTNHATPSSQMSDVVYS